MTKEEIIEGNKLIAEFMGLQVIELNGDLCHYKSMFTVEYHTSWDWIMPVVEKIDNIATEPIKQFAGLQIFELGLTAEIKTVWLAVVEFIKFYNQPK